MKNNTLQYELFPIFPTAVFKFNIGRKLTKKENEVIINSVSENYTYRNAGNSTSLDTYLFKNKKELKKIHEFCLSCSNEYLEKIIQPIHDVELYITQSWGNSSKTNEFHHLHQHPNSFLSGVFYAQTNDDDRIQFENPSGYHQILLHPKEYNPFNSTSWWIPVKTGDVVVFNSSLWHRVEPVKGNVARISIAFNTFLKGKFGDNRSLTELILE